MTAGLPHTASVHIAADPERVFDYFTKPAAILRWMGDYAVLDPHPGGQFTLDINGVPVRGRYLAVDRPHRLVLSWGHAGSDRLPPGASTVEITFAPDDGGTIVTVVHAGLPAADAEQHRLGWAHFLDRLLIAAGGGDPGPDPWAAAPPAEHDGLCGHQQPLQRPASARLADRTRPLGYRGVPPPRPSGDHPSAASPDPSHAAGVR